MTNRESLFQYIPHFRWPFKKETSWYPASESKFNISSGCRIYGVPVVETASSLWLGCHDTTSDSSVLVFCFVFFSVLFDSDSVYKLYISNDSASDLHLYLLPISQSWFFWYFKVSWGLKTSLLVHDTWHAATRFRRHFTEPTEFELSRLPRLTFYLHCKTKQEQNGGLLSLFHRRRHKICVLGDSDQAWSVMSVHVLSPSDLQYAPRGIIYMWSNILAECIPAIRPSLHTRIHRHIYKYTYEYQY